MSWRKAKKIQKNTRNSTGVSVRKKQSNRKRRKTRKWTKTKKNKREKKIDILNDGGIKKRTKM